MSCKIKMGVTTMKRGYHHEEEVTTMKRGLPPPLL
jgi:hypothetical protein